MEEKYKYPENYIGLQMHIRSLEKQMEIINRSILDLYSIIDRSTERKEECVKVLFTPKYK